MVVIGQRWRNVLGSLIQALVAFLGDACFAERGVLLHLGPERLIGGSNLARNITGHLGGQAVLQADIIVTIPLQGTLITHLAMLKRVSAHIVQCITIRQLCFAQCLELCRVGMQFQLGRDHLFHSSSVADIHTNVKYEKV